MYSIILLSSISLLREFELSMKKRSKNNCDFMKKNLILNVENEWKTMCKKGKRVTHKLVDNGYK